MRITAHVPQRIIDLEKFPGGIANYAEAIRDQVSGNLKQGRAPDGSYLGGLDGDASERRDQLAAQQSRGGAAHPRYKDEVFRRKVDSNWDHWRRLTNPVASRPRGYFSGYLANSLSVSKLKGREDGVFGIYQPFNRSLSRVLKGRKVYNERASETDHIKDALLRTLEMIQILKKRR